MKTILFLMLLAFVLEPGRGGISGWVYAAETTKLPRPRIYDEAADGSKQIAEALSIARKTDKYVLLQFGANWCSWCLKLHNLFESDTTIGKMLASNYVVVLIDVNKDHNRDLVRRYEAEFGFGLPFIVILDPTGKRLITKNTADLEEGDHHSRQKVLSFLSEWSPERIRNKPASEWVEEFVRIPEMAFDTNSLELRRVQELGARAVPALLEVIRFRQVDGPSLRETQKAVRACWALATLGPSARSAVPFLAEQFWADDLRGVLSRHVFPTLGLQAHAAIPVLIDAFHRDNPRMQFDAAFALAHIDPANPELAPTMMAWLASTNVYCRRVAPLVLAELGQAAQSATPALKRASEDSDETVRGNAIKALRKISGDSSDPTKAAVSDK